MTSIAIAALGSAFFYGVIAHRDGLPPISQLRAIKHALESGDPLVQHLQPSRGQGKGVKPVFQDRLCKRVDSNQHDGTDSADRLAAQFQRAAGRLGLVIGLRGVPFVHRF